MRGAPSGRSTLAGLLRRTWLPLGVVALPAIAGLTMLAALAGACSDADTPHPGPPGGGADTGVSGDGAADGKDGTDAKDAFAVTDATDAGDADATLGETSADAPEASDAADPTDADAQAIADGSGGDADAADAVVYGGMCTDAAAEASAPSGSCNAVVQSFPDDGHAHVADGSPVAYCTMPPSSGTHYGDWARYRTYDTPVPWGYLVHDMEHGAVIVLYKCAGSCPAVAAQLQAVIDARPVDALCDPDAGVSRRVILAPAPDLDVPIAAAAWQWTYKASCVDAASLGAFIDAHYAMAAENFCGDGAYP